MEYYEFTSAGFSSAEFSSAEFSSAEYSSNNLSVTYSYESQLYAVQPHMQFACPVYDFDLQDQPILQQPKRGDGNPSRNSEHLMYFSRSTFVPKQVATETIPTRERHIGHPGIRPVTFTIGGRPSHLSKLFGGKAKVDHPNNQVFVETGEKWKQINVVVDFPGVPITAKRFRVRFKERPITRQELAASVAQELVTFLEDGRKGMYPQALAQDQEKWRFDRLQEVKLEQLNYNDVQAYRSDFRY